MMLPLALLPAAELPYRVVPHGLGVQNGECFSVLHNGARVVRRTRYISHFIFDRDYALESYSQDDDGGMGAYKRYGSQWCVITRGGGSFGESDLAQLGVPADVAHRLFHPRAVKAADHR